MLKYLPLAATLIAAPAFAQQAQQPSPQAQLFASNHLLQMCLSDDNSVTSRTYDIETQLQAAQKQIATLEAQLKKPAPTAK
jgi:hypothetical protein